MDLYELLGIPKDASKQDIKRAYRAKAQKEHPDKGGDVERFQELARAFAILYDDEKRAHYDATGEEKKDGVDPMLEVYRALAALLLEAVDIGPLNLKEVMRDSIDAGIKDREEGIDQMEKKIDSRRKVQERFVHKAKDKPDVIRDILEGDIQKLEVQIDGMRKQILLGQKMRELLDGYDYLMPKQPDAGAMDMMFESIIISNGMKFTYGREA